MHPLPVSYRPMTPADYEAVTSLWSDTAGVELTAADSRAATERYLARNPNLSFVACCQDRVVGAVLSGHDGRRGYLHHLAVAESHRGRGIGSHLVRLCIEALTREGIAKTHLFVLNTNPSGRAFWQRMGWHLRDDVTMFSHASAADHRA